MESAQSTGLEQTKQQTIIFTKVKQVYLTDQGWFVQFEGSHESLFFGETKPYEVGDRVKITFEKVN